eukprot:462695-Pleurochrysis_carterae.AAC.1
MLTGGGQTRQTARKRRGGRRGSGEADSKEAERRTARERRRRTQRASDCVIAERKPKGNRLRAEEERSFKEQAEE